MKKVLVLLITTMFLVSCEGPMGPEGPIGMKGEPGEGTDWYITSITIDKSEWKLVGEPNELNSYYFVDKPLAKLTDYIYKNGAVVAYIETEKNVKNGLPYVLHKGGEDSKGEFFWTQTFDFDYHPGGVGFYLTYSDFSTNIRPETETFHIVLMW